MHALFLVVPLLMIAISFAFGVALLRIARATEAQMRTRVQQAVMLAAVALFLYAAAQLTGYLFIVIHRGGLA